MRVAGPALLGLMLAALVGGSLASLAHVNDRGMDYSRYRGFQGIACCDNTDCHPASDFVEGIDEHRQAVVRLLVNGEWITAPRYMVVREDATDGRAHWCGYKVVTGSGGQWRPAHRCVILPPRNT
jgi:hypothetical protein